jgi:hypothetical protein
MAGWRENFKQSFAAKQLQRGETKGQKHLTQPNDSLPDDSLSRPPKDGAQNDQCAALSAQAAPAAQATPAAPAPPTPQPSKPKGGKKGKPQRRRKPWLKFHLPHGSAFAISPYDAEKKLWVACLSVPVLDGAPLTFQGQGPSLHNLLSDLGWQWFSSLHPKVVRPTQSVPVQVEEPSCEPGPQGTPTDRSQDGA